MVTCEYLCVNTKSLSCYSWIPSLVCEYVRAVWQAMRCFSFVRGPCGLRNRCSAFCIRFSVFFYGLSEKNKNNGDATLARSSARPLRNISMQYTSSAAASKTTQNMSLWTSHASSCRGGRRGHTVVVEQSNANFIFY